MEVVAVVFTALWVMLPAYIPNNVAVLVGGGRTIDGGRSWRNRRLLGDGKTWRGTIGGVIAGMSVAAGLTLLQPPVMATTGIGLPRFPILAWMTLPAGAMLGDIGGSFVKRRTDRDRGAPFPLIDQLDFVVGALVLTALGLPAWFRDTFTLSVVLVVLLMTPLLHVGTNVIGYVLGVKQEPY